MSGNRQTPAYVSRSISSRSAAAQPAMEIRSTKHIIPMCLGSICRGSAYERARGRIEISDNRVNAYTNGAILKARARRGAGDIQMASISAKLLPISTRNLDAELPSREKGEQTVLADSYSIVLQPLIWISYGHSIRRFSVVQSYVVEGVIDFHGNPRCV